MASATESDTSKTNIDPSTIIISSVTKEDLPDLAYGYYTCFPSDFHDKYEPVERRPSEEVRLARFAKRLEPWLLEPNTYWRKATLASNPKKVIAHAGWLMPGREPYINLFRRDATQALGWCEKMGWTEEEEKELWEAVEVEAFQQLVIKNDNIRKETMGDEGHWFLAPLWVLPEYQKRGIASLLLKEVIALADAENPPAPIYLEASERGRPVYEHFGWKGIPGDDRKNALVRRGPPKTGDSIAKPRDEDRQT